MIPLQNSTQNTVAHRKVSSQAVTQLKPASMFDSREKSKRKPTNENFDSTQRKKSKQDDLLSTSRLRLDLPSSSTTFAHGTQRTRKNIPEFSAYRARRSLGGSDSVPRRQPNQNVLRAQSINKVTLPDDDDDENEDELNFDHNPRQHANEDEYDLIEEHVSQRQNRVASHRNARPNNIPSHSPVDEADDSDVPEDDSEDTATNRGNLLYQTYFNEKFDQLRADLANTTNIFADNVQTQLVKIDKQMKSLSKSVQDHSHQPILAIYQNLSIAYPKTVEFNGVNLLTVAKAADYKKYARTILKILFSADELSNSILISNPNYARPGLDPARMAIWTEAVGARFKIDRDRFDDFFRTCLRRTMAQLLCDVRRDYKEMMNNRSAGVPDDRGSAHGALPRDDSDSRSDVVDGL